MDVKIKEFEKAAIEAVSGLRNELGAKRVTIEIHVDNYESGCKTDVRFLHQSRRMRHAFPDAAPLVKAIKTPILCQRQLNFTTRPNLRVNLSTIG